MKKTIILIMTFCMILPQAGCSRESKAESKVESNEQTESAPVIEIEEPDEAMDSDTLDMAVTDTENDFISKHGSTESRETESSELNNTMWCSFESYNKSKHEYGDYRSETSGEFKNANINFGEMGEGVLYLGDEEIEFTYVLAEYPTKAEGKTKTGEDISMEFYTFNFDGSDIETIKMEIGEWSIDFWPLG